MNPRFLTMRLLAPEGDLGGGGGEADAVGAATSEAEAGGAAPTLEDTARETYRALMAEGGHDEETGEGSDPAAKQTGKARGADGRFAKQAGTEVAAAADKPEGAAPAATDPAAQAKPHDAFPSTWRKELSETWSALPENVREQVHRREQQFHDGIRQYKDAAGFGSTIAQEMLPYQRIMQQRGVTPQTVVRDIMASLNTMVTGNEESKAQVFLKMADDYGINIDTVMSLRQRAPSQAAPDFSPVLQRVQQLETRIQQADQQREQELRDEDERTVLAFLNDPKNEHARTVAEDMTALLVNGRATNLQEAYEKAIWSHPEVRAKLLAKQEAERRKKEAEEAAAARKASGANVHRRGTPPAPAKPGSMEDTARAAYRKAMGTH